MPPVYQPPKTAHKESVPAVHPPNRLPPARIVPLDSMRRSKFRVPVLQILSGMSPGCGMPLRTLAYLVADTVSTKQDMRYFGGNLVQMVLGYTDRSKANRFEPTLIGLMYVSADVIEVEDGISETIYYVTPLGRAALEDYEARNA